MVECESCSKLYFSSAACWSKTRASVTENFVVQIFILIIRVINTKVKTVKNQDHQRNGFSSTRQNQGYCSGTLVPGSFKRRSANLINDKQVLIHLSNYKTKIELPNHLNHGQISHMCKAYYKSLNESVDNAQKHTHQNVNG